MDASRPPGAIFTLFVAHGQGIEEEQHDADLAWAGAARRAFALHGRPLEGCYVITRYGWLDLDTGRSRTWKRLRI